MFDEHTEVNIPLLRKAVEWAEAEAAKPDQRYSNWLQDTFIYEPDKATAYFVVNPIRASDCGTCFCIAGFIANETLRPGETLTASGIETADGRVVSYDHRAEEELGLPIGQWFNTEERHLFDDNNSIEDVRRLAEELAGEKL